VEYPGREDRTWKIVVFDRNGKPMYFEENLSRAEAESLADKWIARPDVSRVEGKEAVLA
jgi:hypothetical protein